MLATSLSGAASAQNYLTAENPIHNPLNPLDVNGDGFITPIDVLLVIDHLTEVQPPSLAGPLAGPLASSPPYFWDTNGDGYVTPMDALLVVDHLTMAPEPSSFIEASTAIVLMAGYIWRRRKRHALQHPR